MREAGMFHYPESVPLSPIDSSIVGSGNHLRNA
jgi:hypothetical protein